ncbi:MAG: hypothetical protein KF764_02900 [Labilithrix sp.]|nr:hypothetical protein [Labilithrix sp.]
MPWPAHLAKTKTYLVEAMRIMKLHGRMRCEPRPGVEGGHRITIVIDVPPPEEPGSDRARKREAGLKRG